MLEFHTRWVDAIEQIVYFLHEQYFQDVYFSTQLSLLERNNLLELINFYIEKLEKNTSLDISIIDKIIEISTTLEIVFINLPYLKILPSTFILREKAAIFLEEKSWSRAHFMSIDSQIDQFLLLGESLKAYNYINKLLKNCLNAGENAYPEAAYDISTAYFTLDRVLKEIGNAQEALEAIYEAKNRFEILKGNSDINAPRMVAVCLTDIGDCMRILGRLDAAKQSYEKAMIYSKQQDDRRQIAVISGQLGTVWLHQGEYIKALKLYEEARDIFISLNEKNSIAIMSHQIGMLNLDMNQWDDAERSYRNALPICVQTGNKTLEYNILLELGSLYGEQDDFEKAIYFYRQAVDISIKLEDKVGEGRARNNIAVRLLQLNDYSEARSEIYHAIKCIKKSGHTVQPWKMWDTLYQSLYEI